jgi:PIN domain nuclease of toxin-antitoxin system
MNFLLDTHVALWALSDDERLTKEARGLITNEDNRIFASVASMWEIAVKKALKPDRMLLSGKEFFHYCRQAGYELLPIREVHVLSLENLPALHSDPFDRILIAQASAESLALLTHDSIMAKYGSAVRLI